MGMLPASSRLETKDVTKHFMVYRVALQERLSKAQKVGVHDPINKYKSLFQSLNESSFLYCLRNIASPSRQSFSSNMHEVITKNHFTQPLGHLSELKNVGVILCFLTMKQELRN